MVSLSGAGVGEEVSPDVIRNFRNKTSDQLVFLRGRGLSDQRRALIDTILAERKAGVTIPEKTLVKGLSESRTIIPEPVKKTIIQTTTPQTPTRPPSTVEALKRPTGIQGTLYDINVRQDILRTKKRRQGSLSIKEEVELAKLGVKQLAIETALIPKNVKDLASAIKKNPSVLKELPSSFRESVKEEVKLLKVDPTSGFVKIGGEILFFKGTGKAIEVVGKVSPKVATILSPKFRKIEGEVLEVPSMTKGKTLKLKVVEKIPTEKISKQLALEGEEVLGVSAQADRIVSLLKGKKTIRKPIPNENLLTQKTKTLLKKFDKGTINKNQLINLEKRIKVETKGKGSLIERTFFADPRGRIRKSRLGLKQKEANLLDVLAGDVTFKSPKPQVLVFEKTPIEKFPKTKEFIKIKNKLKSGRALTKAEAQKLLEFQLKPTGKFKPLGKLSRESEIVLSPSEIVKKDKVIAKTLFNGKKVPIVRAKIVKPTRQTRELLKKLRKGNLGSKEIKFLEKRLAKETGFKVSLSRSSSMRPRVRLKKAALRSGLRSLRKSRIKRTPKRVSARISPKVVKRTPKLSAGKRKRKVKKSPRAKVSVKKYTTKKPTRRIAPISPRKRPVSPRKKRKIIRLAPKTISPRAASLPKGVPIILKKKRSSKAKRSKARSYNVYARPLRPVKTKKGLKRKLIKVNKVPLSKKRAEDLRNYIVDTSLSRTGRIKPSNAKAKKPRLKVPSGYGSKTKVKFRKYRIVKGKRVPLKRGVVIERGKRLLDTSPEKRQIDLRRRIAHITPKARPKRKLSSKQLAALKMGREKLMKKRKKR